MLFVYVLLFVGCLKSLTGLFDHLHITGCLTGCTQRDSDFSAAHRYYERNSISKSQT